jgi:hypothetical protein
VCAAALCATVQVIAYNKVDLPDSGDYWEFVKEYLRVSTHNAPTHIQSNPARALLDYVSTHKYLRASAPGVRTCVDEQGVMEDLVPVSLWAYVCLPSCIDATGSRTKPPSINSLRPADARQHPPCTHSVCVPACTFAVG